MYESVLELASEAVADPFHKMTLDSYDQIVGVYRVSKGNFILEAINSERGCEAYSISLMISTPYIVDESSPTRYRVRSVSKLNHKCKLNQILKN
jgi:hypothetical protein